MTMDFPDVKIWTDFKRGLSYGIVNWLIGIFLTLVGFGAYATFGGAIAELAAGSVTTLVLTTILLAVAIFAFMIWLNGYVIAFIYENIRK
jgi:magnesium-transporting ATPase (P-type)